MRYTVSTVYTREDFIGFMQAYTDRNNKIKGMGYITTYGTKMASAVMLFGGVYNLYTMFATGAWDTKLLISSIALIIIACGLSMIPVDELAGRRTWNQYPLQGMKITYDFEAGGFTETRQGNEYKHNYKDIIELYADEERYYLYVKENSAYMICKRGFTEGNAEEFAKYIENKTGLKMKVKGVKEEKPKEEYWNDEDEDDEDEEN
jgi:hypothetical protein